ncbi:DUF2242 domain-containing protein [Luteimonas wenzhouensis]|uniref:DUF2242 domain-containing protein n=1 Tax=Luteimonas wenzhouensis TaxID=2599615 RepID=UPI001FE753C2|nr:DUF2242 domain-containing protein [Luteimonas wenzhouensis]
MLYHSLPSPPPGARRRGLATGCVLLALALSACGGRGVHRAEAPPLGETFGAEDTYSREYPVPPAVACEAARRALLGQGYVIGRADDETLEATKVFQPESDLHTQLNLRATCVERADGGSIVFLNAVQDRHVLRTQSSSASVGVSMIGSVSLPVPIGNNANLVRVGSNTVQNRDFYRRLFDRVAYYLPGTPRNAPPPEPEPEGPPDPVGPEPPTPEDEAGIATGIDVDG